MVCGQSSIANRQSSFVRMKAADVVVIGAGVVGAATAYYLAKAGADVVLIDRRGPITGGAASGASAGGVRQQGRVAQEIPLAIHAIGLWTGLEDELAADLEYRRDGMTVVTEQADLIESLRQRVARERSLGLDVHVIGERELHDLIPGLSRPMLAGSYCPTDGHANPMRAVDAFCRAAQELGARLRWPCPALAFELRNDRVASVRTAQGSIACGTAVLAAGMWSRELAEHVGLQLPLHTFPLQMMVTARRPHVLDQVLGWIGRGISLKQVPTGGFVIGGGWPGEGDLDTYETRLLPGSIAKSALVCAELLPGLAGTSVVRAWVGIESFCADDMPIVGPVGCPQGLLVAAGFSGHGFALAPAVGSLLAEYVTKGQLSELLKPFGLDRFKGKQHSTLQHSIRPVCRGGGSVR
jgi:sarcosine oxidase subunit beta